MYFPIGQDPDADSKVFDPHDVARDVLSWEAYEQAHDARHATAELLPRADVEKVCETIVMWFENRHFVEDRKFNWKRLYRISIQDFLQETVCEEEEGPEDEAEANIDVDIAEEQAETATSTSTSTAAAAAPPAEAQVAEQPPAGAVANVAAAQSNVAAAAVPAVLPEIAPTAARPTAPAEAQVAEQPPAGAVANVAAVQSNVAAAAVPAAANVIAAAATAAVSAVAKVAAAQSTQAFSTHILPATTVESLWECMEIIRNAVECGATTAEANPISSQIGHACLQKAAASKQARREGWSKSFEHLLHGVLAYHDTNYVLADFGSMHVGLDTEDSDRDINVQGCPPLRVGIASWMIKAGVSTVSYVVCVLD